MQSYSHLGPGARTSHRFPMQTVRMAVFIRRESVGMYRLFRSASARDSDVVTLIDHLIADAHREAELLERSLQRCRAILQATVLPPAASHLLTQLPEMMIKTIRTPTYVSKADLLIALTSLERRFLILLEEIHTYIVGSGNCEEFEEAMAQTESRIIHLPEMYKKLFQEGEISLGEGSEPHAERHHGDVTHDH